MLTICSFSCVFDYVRTPTNSQQSTHLLAEKSTKHFFLVKILSLTSWRTKEFAKLFLIICYLNFKESRFTFSYFVKLSNYNSIWDFPSFFFPLNLHFFYNLRNQNSVIEILSTSTYGVVLRMCNHVSKTKYSIFVPIFMKAKFFLTSFIVHSNFTLPRQLSCRKACWQISLIVRINQERSKEIDVNRFGHSFYRFYRLLTTNKAIP